MGEEEVKLEEEDIGKEEEEVKLEEEDIGKEEEEMERGRGKGGRSRWRIGLMKTTDRERCRM